MSIKSQKKGGRGTVRSLTAEEWVFFVFIPLTITLTLVFSGSNAPELIAKRNIHLLTTLMAIFFVVLTSFRPIYSTLTNLIESEEKIKSTIQSELGDVRKRSIQNCLMAVAGFLLVGFSIDIITRTVYTSVTEAEVVNASLFLYSIDSQIVSIHEIFDIFSAVPPWLSEVIVTTYNSLIPFLAVGFFILLFFGLEQFRYLMLASIVVVGLAIPIWLTIPAISPDELFYQNITNNQQIVEQNARLKIPTKLNDLRVFLNSTQQAWSRASQNFYAVSTIPSMHVAWAFILLVSMAWWKRVTLLLLTPWFLLLLVSTVFTLQHYIVDALLGIGVGIISLLLTQILIKYSSNSYPKHYKLIRQDNS